MLVHKVGNVELHQVSCDRFVISENGTVIKRSRDLDALESLICDKQEMSNISVILCVKHLGIGCSQPRRSAQN